MSRKVQRSIGKFLNWKTGAGFLVVLLVIIGVGQIFGIWGPIIRALFGTAGPAGGWSCLPQSPCADDSPQDAKFFLISNNGMYTFAGQKIVVWVTVPADWPTYEIGIFDGDSGKTPNGSINWRAGNWDDTNTEAVYALYADPAKNNASGPALGQWNGNTMPNDAWFSLGALTNDQRALSPDRKSYIYRLEITQPIQSLGGNAFKVRSTAFLSTGQTNLTNSDIALVGQIGNTLDIKKVYPTFNGTYASLGTPIYNGDWQFYFYVPTDTKTLVLWDGDFDRGSSSGTALDTDDPNTAGVPSWASADVQPEGIGGTYLGLNGKGEPADNSWSMIYRVGDPVWYEIIDPAGQPIFQNGNPGNPLDPSGTEEWEKFELTADASTYPVPSVADASTTRLQPGMYHWDIHGLDFHNLVFIRTDKEVCPAGECPPPPWCDTECNCPRTIGYWKNNVNKIFIQHKTNGVQETADSITWALRNIALVSPLYRHGINVANPAPISDPTPLTPEEANAILQKSAGNTMLDRALQQNLAMWLNFASSKAGYNLFVSLDGIPGGHYEGSVWDTLNYAQDIILYQRGDASLIERAKDIADLMNNGQIDGGSGGERSCTDATYQQQFPPDKQPPKHQDMPKQPKHDEPPAPPAGCTAMTNQYGVENPTNNPFYGIKFEYQSGTEVKDGMADSFSFSLTPEQAAAMTSIQLEAKAGEVVGTATLDGCLFDSASPCDHAASNNGFTWSFTGAFDNGNGLLTLTFTVANANGFGLSHATFGLPDGVVPPETGGYQSQYCQ